MAQSEAPALLHEMEQLSATQLKCERRWTASGQKEKHNWWDVGQDLFQQGIFAVKAAGS